VAERATGVRPRRTGNAAKSKRWEFGTREGTIKVQRGHVMQELGAQSADVVRFVERLQAAGHLPTDPKLQQGVFVTLQPREA
jgi:hypothetical protein